jgi:glutamate racemase
MRHDGSSPIGVFDSGVGGLTVLKAIAARLPNESTVYLGDTARVPYGTKSGEVVVKYSLANARVLLDAGVKILVVACNTASAYAKAALQKLPVPVVGVVEPGARAAARATRSGRVAVIGTPGTIASGADQRAIESFRPGTKVRLQSCPLFVPLAEEGWVDGDVPELVARRYLTSELLDGVDTLVLGCTHYPLLASVIQRVVGPNIALVDSAEATADYVARVLTQSNLLRAEPGTVSRRFFVTDTPEPFLGVAARFFGAPVDRAEQIDLELAS